MRTCLKILIAVVLVFPIGESSAQKVIGMRSLLREMVDYGTMARWPSPAYTEKQASSYDRKSVSPNQPGWFANADFSQYIRTETNSGRKEMVMMDADGPGAIVRFWLTTFKRHGNLRIYFDNHPEPALTIPAYDLMKSGLDVGPALLAPHSSYEPKEKGGSTLYLPLPYAKHCKVTWEDLDTTKEPRYYQINYRTYPKGTRVETFSLAQVGKLKPLIDSVNSKLLKPDTAMIGMKMSINQAISHRETSIKLPAGPNAVEMLAIHLNRKQVSDSLLNELAIAFNFDDTTTAIAPLLYFAGSGEGGRPLQSFYRTVTADGTIYLRWVMPYNRSGKIILINLNTVDIPISLTVNTVPWHWDQNSMYFHADIHSAIDIPVKKSEEDKPIEWTFCALKGRGVFLGDSFSVFNHMHSWYGEGDQNLSVDADTFPSEHGTGTEDYYNTSWAPVVLYQTPFANAPRADNQDSYGENTFTRTRNLDRVPFNSQFTYNLEMLGWQNGTINASTVVYWYGFKTAYNQTVKTLLEKYRW